MILRAQHCNVSAVLEERSKFSRSPTEPGWVRTLVPLLAAIGITHAP